ncbi:MAG: hypothetical protein IKA71_06225 [Lentisphaeria bacterium]|nr:hypothetical protein [Lentisphaeria bacterium]
MECFGNFTQGSPACKSCDYVLSCRYCQRTGEPSDRREHLVSFEAVQDFMDFADNDHIPGEENCSESETSEIISALSSFFRYLLDLDTYTLAIIAEVIKPQEPGVHCTIPYLSRLRGCSRQAMHRKMMKIIGAHPELSALFRNTLYKLSDARQNFLRRRAAEKVKK